MDKETRLHGNICSSVRIREVFNAHDLAEGSALVHISGLDLPVEQSFDRLPDANFIREPPSLALWVSKKKFSGLDLMQILLFAVLILVTPLAAVSVDFENCLSPNTINSDPKQLQFTPLFVNATFDAISASHNLNITVYGNVSGIATSEKLPPLGDPRWNNSKDNIGKIPNVPTTGKLRTVIKAFFNVLDYRPYTAQPVAFCDDILQGQCPVGPVFETHP